MVATVKSEKLLFGTAGVPRSSILQSTESGIERVAELGLNCLEVQFVRGVKMNEGMARQVGEVAKKCAVRLTAHAPYFINLNAHEKEKVLASQERLIQAARIASLFGAVCIVFHAASYLNDSPAAVYDRAKGKLEETVRKLRASGNRVLLRPETRGKGSQFGTLDEILNLSAEIEGVAPCIDFSHLHARTGNFNSYGEFMAILKQVEERLGRQALEQMHIHLSGIQYDQKGEIKHLNLKDSDLRYVELLRALKELEVKGLIICESPEREGDALLLQETYNSL
ncbi:MAG TPA: TIM barrel protein [Dehalococcoidia bacterium]|nr:TIM barrel protein [Dehalococcoidia bacterium]